MLGTVTSTLRDIIVLSPFFVHFAAPCRAVLGACAWWTLIGACDPIRFYVSDSRPCMQAFKPVDRPSFGELYDVAVRHGALEDVHGNFDIVCDCFSRIAESERCDTPLRAV